MFFTDLSLRLNSATSDSEPLSLSSLDSNPRVHVTVRSPSPRLIQKELPPLVDSKRENRKINAVNKTRPPPAPPENHEESRLGSPRRQNATKVNNVMKYVSSETKTEFSIK